MRNRIKLCLLLCIVGMLIMCAGCSAFREYRHEFDQPFDNVVKVEIMRYHDAIKEEDTYITPITEIDLETAKEMLAEIGELPSYKSLGDPSKSYGSIIIYITYANGEAEVIGHTSAASITVDGEWWPEVQYFKYVHWYTMLLKYVDPELIPEAEEYLE